MPSCSFCQYLPNSPRMATIWCEVTRELQDLQNVLSEVTTQPGVWNQTPSCHLRGGDSVHFSEKRPHWETLGARVRWQTGRELPPGACRILSEIKKKRLSLHTLFTAERSHQVVQGTGPRPAVAISACLWLLSSQGPNKQAPGFPWLFPLLPWLPT